MAVRSVSLTIPTLGLIDVQVVSRLFTLHRPLNAKVTPCWPVGMATATARIKAVEAAIKADCTHIFFLDHDVLLPPETLTVLAAHNRPIACGLYYTKSKPPEPLLIRDEAVLADWEHGDLVEVDVTGLGCALIDLEVFKELEQPWFETGTRYTEDSYFYRKLAKATGIRPVVDTGLCCAHKDLATGELFFWDKETGKPTWMDLTGEKHVIAKESEVADEETRSVAADSGADCDASGGAGRSDGCD